MDDGRLTALTPFTAPDYNFLLLFPDRNNYFLPVFITDLIPTAAAISTLTVRLVKD